MTLEPWLVQSTQFTDQIFTAVIWNRLIETNANESLTVECNSPDDLWMEMFCLWPGLVGSNYNRTTAISIYRWKTNLKIVWYLSIKIVYHFHFEEIFVAELSGFTFHISRSYEAMPALCCDLWNILVRGDQNLIRIHWNSLLLKRTETNTDENIFTFVRTYKLNKPQTPFDDMHILLL